LIDLVRQCKRLFLEANAAAGVLRQLPRFLRCDVAHSANLAARSQADKTGRERLLFPKIRNNPTIEEEREVEGYEVISAVDGKSMGHVVDKIGDNLVIEHGSLRKHRNALPLEFAEVDETNQQVLTTLSAELVHDSPTVENGDIDAQAVRAHYGLTDTTVSDEQLERLDRTADDDYYSAGLEPESEQIAEIEEGLNRGVPGPADDSPALLGDRFDEVPRTGDYEGDNR
jgi:hypothetical protein